MGSNGRRDRFTVAEYPTLSREASEGPGGGSSLAVYYTPFLVSLGWHVMHGMSVTTVGCG